VANFPVPELGNLTATAILGWYAWHTASKTIPSLLESFREEMAAHREELRAQSDAFRSEMTAERERRYTDSMAIVEALNKLSRRLLIPVNLRSGVDVSHDLPQHDEEGAPPTADFTNPQRSASR